MDNVIYHLIVLPSEDLPGQSGSFRDVTTPINESACYSYESILCFTIMCMLMCSQMQWTRGYVVGQGYQKYNMTTGNNSEILQIRPGRTCPEQLLSSNEMVCGGFSFLSSPIMTNSAPNQKGRGRIMGRSAHCCVPRPQQRSQKHSLGLAGDPPAGGSGSYRQYLILAENDTSFRWCKCIGNKYFILN